jgi:HlyD family secretion protein
VAPQEDLGGLSGHESMKKALITLIILGAGGGAFAYYNLHKSAPAPTVTTAVVTRGDIADTVGATGTLQAVTTVQVGTQVSGIIQDLYADFNTLVKKGQVIARLDPSTIQTQIEQARANLVRSQADLERLRVSLDDAQNKLKRAEELNVKKLIPTTDLETAQVNVRSAVAQLRSSEAAITQSEASLKQNEVNLEHTIITAPIDGLVISRNVDRGQTVASSMQAPTLFILAADLTKMQVVANLDESDVGRIRPGQNVSFHVDAYPAETFQGTVTQVRLQPIMQQNVVTYATVIAVPNPELKLKPGMTANVNVEIARRNNVIRMPNAALRFRPTNEIYAALGQTPPDNGGGRGRGGSGAPTTNGNSSTANQPSGGPPARSAGESQPAAGQPTQVAANQTPGDRGRSPAPSAEAPVQWRGAPEGAPAEGRAQGARDGAQASADGSGRGGNASRFGGGRGRGGDPSARTGNQAAVGGRGTGARGGAAPKDAPAVAITERNTNATTIDALFGPLPVVESRGRVWLYAEKRLRAVPVRLGISDGQATELLEGDVQPGTEVVTNVTTGNEARPTPQGAFPPFMGQPGRGFPGQGGPRGGGGGGRGR